MQHGDRGMIFCNMVSELQWLNARSQSHVRHGRKIILSYPYMLLDAHAQMVDDTKRSLFWWSLCAGLKG